MDPARCPRCGDNTTVAGWQDVPDHARYFQPDGIHWLRHMLWHFGQTTHVNLPDRFQACLACGLIWNSLPPEQLRKVVEREAVEVGEKEWEPPPID
jgi:hypothetical protein